MPYTKSECITFAREGRAPLVLKNAKVANVFTRDFQNADIAVAGETIVGVGSYSGETEIDCGGQIVCPGFIDSHEHIESSMAAPAVLAEEILKHGTTTIFADPHEITNVAGPEGIEYMLEQTEGLPLSVFIMLPSCVPATPFEHSGCTFTAHQMRRFRERARVLGLAEVMDAAGVVGLDKDMLEKLTLFENSVIDGHAPLVSGHKLDAYRLAGPMTDHECSGFEEIMEKIASGMYVQLRIGSAANNVDELFRQIAETKVADDRFLLCTDDKHLEEIRAEGHIDHILRRAVLAGIPPFSALRMATINSASAYRLFDRGAIAPGYRADLVFVEDLRSFRVTQVWTGGVRYDGRPIPPSVPVRSSVLSSVRIPPLSEASLRLPAQDQNPVIELTQGTLLTRLLWEELPQENGYFQPKPPYVKAAVIERHHATGHIGVAALRNFPIRGGAIASTVAHDSHNLILAGDNDADMLLAARKLVEAGGGQCVVRGGKLLSLLPLPIGGLMSDLRATDIILAQRALLDAAGEIGLSGQSNPFMLLSFLALPVIPDARLTDIGVFSVSQGRFV